MSLLEKTAMAFVAFGLLYVERKTHATKKEECNKTCPEKLVFLGCGWENGMFKRGLLENCKTCFVFGRGQERASAVNTICFGKVIRFCCFKTNRKHSKILGFQQAQGKTQKSPFMAKRVFVERGLLKDYLLSVISQKAVVLSVFSQKPCSAGFQQNDSFCREKSAS